MIKLIGCLIIIAASTAIGFTLSEKFKKRNNELNEIERCIVQLQNEIIYTHTPLPEAILDVARKSFNPTKEVLESIASLLNFNEVDSVHQAFKKIFKEKNQVLNLTNEDINIILDLSKTLGESDIDGQKRMFAITLDRIKTQIKNSEISVKNNVKMYRCLGFCIGAMVVIVIV